MEVEDGSLDLQPKQVIEQGAWTGAGGYWNASYSDWSSGGTGWGSSSWNDSAWGSVLDKDIESSSKIGGNSNAPTLEKAVVEKITTTSDDYWYSYPWKDKDSMPSWNWSTWNRGLESVTSLPQSTTPWRYGSDWWKSGSSWADSAEAVSSNMNDGKSPADSSSTFAWQSVVSEPWSSWYHGDWGTHSWAGNETATHEQGNETAKHDEGENVLIGNSWRSSAEAWKGVAWKDVQTNEESPIDEPVEEIATNNRMEATRENPNKPWNSPNTANSWQDSATMPTDDTYDWRSSGSTWQDSNASWKDTTSWKTDVSNDVSPSPVKSEAPPAAVSPIKRSLNRKIFVTGLNRDTNPQTLGEYCLTVGEVRFATVFTDPETGQSNGTGKIDFATEEAAQRAIAELSGTWLDGNQITVQPLAGVQAPRENDGRSVFIGGLGYDVGEEQLWTFVAPLGNANFIKIFADRETGRSRGCGKIEFESQEVAQRAISELNGQELNGRRITVEPMGQDSGRRPPRRDVSTKVLFSGLGANTTPQSLGEFCNKWIGGVLFATVHKTEDGPWPSGSGKVDFESEALAKRAVDELNGWWLDNCQIETRCMTDADSSVGPRRDNDGRQVFFGGLSYDVGEDELRAFASAVGNAQVARIFVDRETGRSRGCGRVEFETKEQAQRAIVELNGKSLKGGRQVTVEPMGLDTSLRAVPRPKTFTNGIDGRQVFFAGLSVTMDENGLRSLCESVGKITGVAVFMDRDTGKPRGTGKVEFETVELAQQAVEQFDKQVIDGLVVTARLMSQEPGSRQMTRPTSTTSSRTPVDGRQVFCGGLSQDVNSDELREFFATAGNVTYCTVFVERETGRSKGAGKVEFETVDMAQYAINHLDGQILQGRPVTVRLMNQEPRTRPPADVSKGPPVIDGRQVFVGGLGTEMDTSNLRSLFSDIGGITYASILTDRTTGQPRGSGKVEFETVELAQKAVQAWEGHQFEGRDIIVRIMEDAASRPPRQTRHAQEDVDPETKLFIGSLPSELSDEKLKDVLSQAGEVVSASVFATSMGYAGRAVMASAEEAQRAIDVLHGTFLMEKRIMVRLDAPPGERAPKPNLDSMIFVGGLSFDTSVDDLRSHFAGIGDILHASLFLDKMSGKPRGSAKIEFLSPLLAKRAVEELDESELDGRRLHVKLMEARVPGDGPPGLKPPQERIDGRTVFVGGLSWDVGSEDLKVFASQLGEVSFATVFYDRETGKSRGSGKVQFVSAELAEQAVSELSGRQLMGREVTVRLMEQR